MSSVYFIVYFHLSSLNPEIVREGPTGWQPEVVWKYCKVCRFTYFWRYLVVSLIYLKIMTGNAHRYFMRDQ